MKSKLNLSALKRKKELISEGLMLSTIGSDKNGNNYFKYYNENNKKNIKIYLANHPSIYRNVISIYNYLDGYASKCEVQDDINAINNYIEALQTIKCA